MRHLVKIFEQNYNMFENFFLSTLSRFENLELNNENLQLLFKLLPALELIYTTNNDFIQTSPNITKDLKQNNNYLGIKREYLLYQKSQLKSFQPKQKIFIKQPYISELSGRLCITVIYNRENDFIFLDLQLEELLNQFDLYTKHHYFELLLIWFYSISSFALIGIAIFLGGYGLFNFIHSFHDISLENIFKPVISLTLGLAIFDLGKTVLEQEVLSHEYSTDTFKPKTLIHFTISIIIALMIEALLIVFKIAIYDYHDLIHALYLIIGASILFLTFTVFLFYYKKCKIKK